MVKARVKSKYLTKKHKKAVKHKITKHTDHSKKTNTGEAMTRLEYHQALTDPRFKAAMMGFNNPAGSALIHANHQLQAIENKNNEMTREMAFQTDMANAKQREMDLKNQVSQLKERYKNELRIKNTELATEKHQHEMERLRNQKDFNNIINGLNRTIEQQRRTAEEAQKKFKQEEEIKQKGFESMMQELQIKHDKEINALNERSNELKRQYELESTKYNAEQKLADVVTEKIKAEMNKQFDEKVHPLEEETAELRRQTEIRNQQHNENMETMRASYDVLESNLKAEFQKITHPLQEQSAKLKYNIELLDQQHKDIMEIKRLDAEIQSLQLKSQNQEKLNTLTESVADLKNNIAKNQDELKERLEIKRLETEKIIAEQKSSPEQIANHESELLPLKLEQSELKKSIDRTQEINSNEDRIQELRTEMIEKCTRIFGNDFDPREINESGFNDKLQHKLVHTQKELIKIQDQNKEVMRMIKEQEGLEQAKIEHEKAKAKLEIYQDENSPYNQELRAKAKKKAEYEAETERLKDMADETENFRQENRGLYDLNIRKFQEAMDNDESGFIKQAYIDVTGGDKPVEPKDIPIIFDRVREMYEQNIRFTDDPYSGVFHQPGDLKNEPVLHQKVELLKKLREVDTIRRNLNLIEDSERERISNENRRLSTDNWKKQQQIDDLQQRRKQTEQFVIESWRASSIGTDKDENYQSLVPGIQANKDTVHRIIDQSEDHDYLVMNQENFNNIMTKAGMGSNPQENEEALTKILQEHGYNNETPYPESFAYIPPKE